ncbi:dihydrofolate reductase [Candidatus Bathyarchaeota archaeon]|nr:MAG: dihydrofolate reductase [Candidatus Bathyarchaeota archaeon]TMI31785.1 MAG: dihydrofolate reductase [Candidatus Bathyarchaeota archaeon]
MRKIILAMQVTLDGFVAGPKGELDWLADDEEQGKDLFRMLRSADTFLLGRAMYPGYAKYWRSVLANPAAKKGELKFARIAEKTPHIVFSRTMKKADWKNTRIERRGASEAIRRLKQRAGKNMVVWGGARFASSLIGLGLVDEYRLLVNPVILGKGKPLFRSMNERRRIKLVDAKKFRSGIVLLRYKALKKPRKE